MIALSSGNSTAEAVRLSARLTTPRRFLLAVGASYLLAWCLPSVVYDIMGVVRMRGWDVTWEALTPFWKVGMELSDLLRALLSVSSALTNVVFIVALIHAWRWTSRDRLAAVASGERRPFRWAVWALGASAVVNTHWPATLGFGLLGEGYYLWLLSFVALVALLAWVRVRSRRRGLRPLPA